MLLWTLALIAGIILMIFTIKRKFSKKWHKIVIIIMEILLVLYFAFRIIFPMMSGPKPTGPNQVNVDTVYYGHETEFPEMATGGSMREIPVHVYYPQDMKPGSQPLFLFSHGSFGIGSSNETLFYELASRGYIVMSLDHPHHAFFTKLSTGENIFVDGEFLNEVMRSQGSEDLQGTLESLNRWVDPRIEDIDFVVDKILDDQEDNSYEAMIDRNQIILSGHSLGGSAVLAVGRARPDDIQALVVFEAPFVKDITGIENGKYQFVKEEYPRPILHIYSDSLWGKLDEITTYDLNAQLIHLKDPRFVNHHISGVGHLGLTDMGPGIAHPHQCH